jgi:aryl-alcohol dehydrogenase-like predicted oxidoreductase
MHYRRLGRTGLKVSALCLGTMTFGWSADEATSFSIMDAAVDAGINFFDTADIYSRWVDGNAGGESESIIGRWFARHDRDHIVLATKVRGQMWEGPNGEGLSRTHILRAVEDSLRRLNTDYIDLYQVHWPDKETPLEETLSALDTLVRQGKVRYIGASNYPAWLLMKSLWTADRRQLTPFVCIQPHYSLLHRGEFERELELACIDQGIAVIPYSPLAAGFLTGKYTRENTTPDTTRGDGGLIRRLLANPERSFAVLDEVNRIARDHRVPPSHVALAWLLARPVITAPIIGARTVAQFQDVAGAADLVLLPEEIEALDKASAES